jgi:UDP-N-acetylmuramoyl-L-alanyl-D-glutamate--2,6-diaminopimelate ligase
VIGYLVAETMRWCAHSATGPCAAARREYLEYNRAFKMAPILSDYINEGEILALKGSLDRPISGW